MSYSTRTEPNPVLDSSPRARVRRATGPAAAGVLTAGSALTLWGAHDLREVMIVVGVLLAVVAGVYGYVMPRALRSGAGSGAALVLSVAALLVLLPAFWSALPLALGVAGVMLGHAGRTGGRAGAAAAAAVVLGSLAVVGYFAVYVLEFLKEAGVPWA